MIKSCCFSVESTPGNRTVTYPPRINSPPPAMAGIKMSGQDNGCRRFDARHTPQVCVAIQVVSADKAREMKNGMDGIRV